MFCNWLDFEYCTVIMLSFSKCNVCESLAIKFLVNHIYLSVFFLRSNKDLKHVQFRSTVDYSRAIFPQTSVNQCLKNELHCSNHTLYLRFNVSWEVF